MPREAEDGDWKYPSPDYQQNPEYVQEIFSANPEPAEGLSTGYYEDFEGYDEE